MLDINIVEKALHQESRTQTAYQREGSRYGNLFLGSDIEDSLKYALCVINTGKYAKLTAIFFDDWDTFNDYVSNNKSCKISNFREFQKLTEGRWKNPDLYQIDREHNAVLFALL